MIKTVKGSILLLCFIFLVSCGSTNVTYKEGFPDEDTLGLEPFLHDYALIGYNEVTSENGSHLITEKNVEETREHIGGEIAYLEYTDDELRDFYKPVADDPKKVFASIRPFFSEDKDEKLFRPVTDNDAYQLPSIEIDNTFENMGNIHIETEENEMTIDLDDHDIYRPSVVNILNSGDVGFVLKLEEPRHLEDGSETHYLFSDKQLDNVHITQLTPEKAEEAFDSGALVDFKSLFPTLDGDWISLFDEPYVFNTSSHQVMEVDEADYFSADGGYVYLDGKKSPMSDGVQRIQHIDDYAADNDTYETKFKIDFKKVAKELNFDETDPVVDDARVKYFNKDFIVLRLSFNDKLGGWVGTTNVLIDLEDNEDPIAYMVDLGWG